LEYDEFRRLDRSDADDRDDLAGVDDVRWIGLLVALDEERLLRRGSKQRSVTPDAGQKRPDVAANVLPERAVVGLEDDPVRPLGRSTPRSC
jgi:hypothetical protein